MQKRPQKSKVFAAFLVNKNFRTLFTYYYTVMKRKVNQFFAYFEAPEIDSGLYRAGFHAHDPGFHGQFSEQGGMQEWRLEALLSCRSTGPYSSFLPAVPALLPQARRR